MSAILNVNSIDYQHFVLNMKDVKKYQQQGVGNVNKMRKKKLKNYSRS